MHTSRLELRGAAAGIWLAVLLGAPFGAFGDDVPRGQTAGSAPTNETARAAPNPAALVPTTFYREPGSYGTKRETVPPAYVRNASKIATPYVKDLLKDYSWLDIGLDHRVRYEMRHNDFRRPVAKTDNPFLLRTRAYVGVHDVIDPLRFVFEFEDARRENGDFPKDNRDFNETEMIQMYGQLYFKDLLPPDPRGNKRPLSLRGGRMWFEKLDRRLIANNAWRNTTNTFQGLHLDIGQDANDWQFELIATQPLDRLLFDFDEVVGGQWFFAAIGHWRRWSDVITIEPYYLQLNQKKTEGRNRREVHAPAVRFYGPLGKRMDYDVDLVYETGQDNHQDMNAFGSTVEVGYIFDSPMKPRLSAFLGYATGDEDPNDDDNERFDRFFGFARPWSADDYFIWENLIDPKTRFEITPVKDLRIDAGFSAYWLASRTDRWANANLRDPEGKSGRFIGYELDARARYPVTKFMDATLGYARFQPGGFTKTVGRNRPSDFFYVEVTVNAFPLL